jgi:hypothetical protein
MAVLKTMTSAAATANSTLFAANAEIKLAWKCFQLKGLVPSVADLKLFP